MEPGAFSWPAWAETKEKPSRLRYTMVDIRFGSEGAAGQYLEILDDGTGMDFRTLEEAWCVVATPYRRHNPVATKDEKVRRASGEKGLGRLSAARLGRRLDVDQGCPRPLLVGGSRLVGPIPKR